MTEKTVVLSRPLVVGHKRDGRRGYDPEAKRELIDACRQPGISVARVALEHGLNANLLRKWLGDSRIEAARPALSPAFAPVLAMSSPETSGLALKVVLPNGVELEWRGVGPGDLAPLLSSLAGLSCSGSSRG